MPQQPVSYTHLDVYKRQASGLRAQTARMKVIAENIANANSTSPNAGGNPYQRKIATFGQVLNRETGVNEVKMTKVVADKGEFKMRYDPCLLYTSRCV